MESFDEEEYALEPNADRPGGGWRAALARSQAPTHCAICGLGLTNVRSQEMGIGPECAEKYWRYYENPPLASPESAEAALALLPDPAGTRVRELGQGDAWKHESEVRRAMVQSALWYASYAASFGGDQRETVAEKVDTGLLTISCVETLARAFGYDKVADRMVKKWGWEMQRNRIRFVDAPGGLLGVFAPYSPEFNEACRARRELFPKYEKRSEGFVRYFRAHDLPDVCNLLSASFGDGLAVNPQGNLTTLPAMALKAPPKPTPPAPPPSEATNEVVPYPPGTEDLRLGDEIDTPNGRSIIQYINPKRQSIGVGPQRGRGYTFFSFEQIERINGKKVAADFDKERRAGAAQEGAAAPPAVHLPAELPAGLMKHQVDAVAYVHAHGGRVLIADEPGLGKTAEAIVSWSVPVLVVCPATLKVNWMRECNRWKPGLTVAIIDGMHEPTALQQAADVVVINYDIMHAHAGWLAKRGFKWIVADEAHYLKNLDVRWDKAKKVTAPSPKSPRRAIAFYYVQESIPHMLLLTGTPILNRVKELFPLLHLLDPKTWNSGYKFCVQYCAGHSEFVGRKEIFRCDGRSNMEELHGRLVERFMIRRTKDMLDLPPKQRRSMSVSLSEAGRKEYNKAANEFMKWLEGQQTEELAEGEPGPKERALRAFALRKMTAMREIAARGKAEAASEWIATYFEGTGRPLIVMGHHAAAFDAIVAAVDKLNEEAGRSDAELSRPIRYAKVLGETPMPTRQRAIDAFQAGELDVVFYSISIAVGTTLTRAQDVLFIERDWVPGKNVQAEDRAHRLGQKNTVTITYLDAEGTIDQKIAMLLIDKTATAAGVIDGANLDEFDAAGVVLGELVTATPGRQRGMKANPSAFELADSWEQAL